MRTFRKGSFLECASDQDFPPYPPVRKIFHNFLYNISE